MVATTAGMHNLERSVHFKSANGASIATPVFFELKALATNTISEDYFQVKLRALSLEGRG